MVSDLLFFVKVVYHIIFYYKSINYNLLIYLDYDKVDLLLMEVVMISKENFIEMDEIVVLDVKKVEIYG